MKNNYDEMMSAKEMSRAVAGAYNTENMCIASDDWAAVEDIFGAHDTVIERYADGMVDGNICYRI